MACLKVIGRDGIIRVVPEDKDLNVRTLPGDTILGVEMTCGPVLPSDDLKSLVTEDGLMVGNIIKAVTTKLGIKQCLACKGRQRRYNERGLEIQKKVRNALLRS